MLRLHPSAVCILFSDVSDLQLIFRGFSLTFTVFLLGSFFLSSMASSLIDKDERNYAISVPNNKILAENKEILVRLANLSSRKSLVRGF
jgi:hypothetical protein